MTSTRPLRWIPFSPSFALAPLLAVLPMLPMTLAFSGCAAPLEGVDKEIRPADLASLQSVGAKANGLVVWTSSRDGMPHLFTMKTDGSDTKQLTKGPHTDWNPRFSPDGRRILFSRSRENAFVRESDADAPGTWDLYTVNVDGSEVVKVVEDAAWGSWSSAEEIVFLRGSKILRTKLGGEGESKVLDLTRHAFFDGAIVQQPELSHDGHFVALTLAGNHRQAGIWNIRKKVWTQLGQGAQIAWAPDGASVYWADDGGKDGFRLAREPVVAGLQADDKDPEKLLLVDLGGKRSRERFPRFSNDGKWVIFAAAINDLENDLEDFELYLWEVGTEATSATRLTFNSANDRWPDIFVGAPGAPPAAGSKAAATDDEDEGDKAAPAQTEEKSQKNEQDESAKAPESEPEKKAEPTPEGSDETEAAAPAKTKGKTKGKKKRR